MTDYQKERFIEIISSEIQSRGFVRLNQLTPLLETNGKAYGINRGIYDNQGPKWWLESNFSEFRVYGNNGKEVIVFATDAPPDNVDLSDSVPFAVEVEKLNYSDLCDSIDDGLIEPAYRIGVIDFCNYKNAFINQGHEKHKTVRSDLSVIFYPKLIKTIPENFVFNTKTYIYLVQYAVSGTVKDIKIGADRPALDYNVPIKVIRTLPKKQCAYIRISPEEVIIGHVIVEQSEQDDASVLDKAVNDINAFLNSEINNNGYVLSSDFPDIAKKFNILNFRKYADSVELFLTKYLPEYELKKNIPLQGKLYPGIIIRKGQVPAEIEYTNDFELNLMNLNSAQPEMSFSVLDDLFEAGRYADYLASEILKKVQPQELSLEYVEKALTCAHRLMHPDSSESIKLNFFQQELLNNPTTASFIKKWKNNGIFSEKIVEQCGDTAIAHFGYPEHSSLIAKLLNAIGSEKSLNNNYNGITDRFVACENVLIPHFYIIRAFVQNTKTSILKLIGEYCQIVKDMRQSASGPVMSEDDRMCSFEEVLRVIHSNIFDCTQLTQSIRTNIVSVFLEYDKMLTLKELINLWDIAHTSIEWRLVDLYYNFDKWNETNFVQLINDGVNRQLLQRCLALLWRESYHDNILDKNYLNLLSWVILHDDYTSIDEIIRYPSGKDLSRIGKQNILINTFDTVCDYAVVNDNMYVLASYIIFIVQENISSDDSAADVTEILNKWNNFSSEFYKKKSQHFECITPQTEQSFVNLFEIFQLDISNYLKLQTHYAEWLVHTNPPENLSADDIDELLEEVYNKGAYSAVVDYYSFDLRPEFEAVRKKHTEQYIESLIHLRRYTDAISFLWNSQSLTAPDKNALMIKAIGENFRVNRIYPKAFLWVSDTSMCDEAIQLMLSEFKPAQPLIINSLIALYIHQKKYMNAAYLFTIFGIKSNKGFARLYSQFRSQLGKYVNLNKLKSHYHVIAMAFETLSAADLVDFLSWANGIDIPNYKEHTEGHVFSIYYDNIKADATNENAWLSLFNHLVKVKKGLEINAWDICVCETVLRKVLNNHDNNYSPERLEYILSDTDPERYPNNFLVYAFEIIMDSHEPLLCQKLVEALSNKNLYSHIITNNEWLSTYNDKITEFKQYCQNAYGVSGNPAFHEILSLLGTELSIFEQKEYAHSAASKQALFATICRNYLNDSHMPETIDVLFSEDWSGFTEAEYALLNILRLVCSDDDELLLEAEGLFDDEYSVWRFKRDCVEILSTYPEKTGLFAFDKACGNESYKMLVYSYIFEVFFDQDIYGSLDKKFSDIKNFQTYKVYLRMLECAYKAQSIQNTTFPFFYRKWRYLKLYLARLLRYPSGFDDTDIVELMEKNGLYDKVYAESYVPFVETVKQFMGFDYLPREFKAHFLFALMVSHSEDLYENYAQLLSTLTTQQKLICQKLIAFLDYRNFNFYLYKYLWKNIKNGDFSMALPLAEAISDHAFDTLAALKDNYASSAVSIFEKIAFMEKSSQVVNSIIEMDISVISEHHHWIIPLLCSLQFDFWISNRFRSLVITHHDKVLCDKYKYISDYLAEKGKSLGVYTHLCSLLACLKNNQEQAKRIIGDGCFCSLVPYEWTDEAKRIVDYANGVNQNFKANKTNLDGSQENNDENANFSFPKIILESVFDKVNIPASDQAANDSYKSYLESNDPWMRSKLGLELIRYIVESPSSDITSKLPPLKDLVLDVGLGLLRPEVGLTIENRFAIIKELYDNRSIFLGKEYSDRRDDLMSKFAAMINTGFSLALWIKYSATIEEFLRQTNAIIDFSEIKERILDKCEKLASSDIGNENKIEQYKAIKNNFSGLTSPYSTSVRRAIEDEIERLANGIMLSIEIENSETTDGCVYFQIKNTGKRTVSFASEELSIILQQKNQPEETVKVQNIVELRNGSMTGGVAQLTISSEEKIEVKLSIIHNLPDGSKEVICSESEELLIGPPCSPNVPIEALMEARQSVSSAVTDSRLLFGRDDKKEDLALRIPSGVTLIYGPSRIGKTSLMNWIRNKHAVDQGNVMTVLIGGEAFGREGDYDRNILDKTKDVPYNDPYQMSQYLLVDTIIYGLTRRSIFGKPKDVEVPDDLIKEMLLILKDGSTNIDKKYSELNECLKRSNLELWLLLDEFQRVVERWEDAPAWCEFFEICNLLSSKEPAKPDRIKIVFCGSDDLLTHMILKRDSVWQNTFRSTVSVNALLEGSYKVMLEKEKAITMTNLTFSSSAVTALFKYTGGIALYGKEICRAILEDISEDSQNDFQKWKNRNVIYSYDIAAATQTLLERQNHDLSIRAKEGISTIYSAVTKKLDEYTVMPLLWEMADYLSQNPQQDGFPENYFSKENLTSNFEEKLDDSFSIAEAREIIKKKNSNYTFTTLFYYFAFCGSAPKNKSSYKDLIYAKEDTDTEDEPSETSTSWLEQVIEIVKKQPSVDQYDIGKIIESREDDTLKARIREMYGDNIQTGTYIKENTGTNIGTQNNGEVKILQVNQIANSLVGLSDLIKQIADGTSEYNDKEVKGFLSNMPRLRLLPAGEPINEDDEFSKYDTDAYEETVVEGAKKSIKTDSKFKGKSLEDWARENSDRLNNMGVSKDDLDFTLGLQERDRDSILVALYLRSLFDDIVELSERAKSNIMLDYAPVTVMLSKTLERTLKEKHLPIYLDSNVWVNKVNTYSEDKDKKRAPITFAGITTIGTFTTALFSMFKIIPSDPEKAKKEENRNNFIKRTGTNERNWKPYMYDLYTAKKIRNTTTHVELVTQEDCDRFVQLMFRSKLLKNTTDYVCNPNNN